MGNQKIVVTVDIGIHALGVAVDDGTQLLWAGLVRGSAGFGIQAGAAAAWALDAELVRLGYRPTHGVIELPTQDDRRAVNNRGTITDLSHVAGAVGCILYATTGDKVLTPTAMQWKGQVPKHIHHDRILGGHLVQRWLPKTRGWVPNGVGKLTQLEADRIRWDKDKDENRDIADAIGLALWSRGKF